MEPNNPILDAGDGDARTASGADTAVIADPTAQLSAITAERDQLAAERADLHDRYLRRQAEFENFRRRVERESAEFKQYAASEAIQAMLPVVDDFERALKQESSDKEYQRGMELIYQHMMDALKKLGLEPITAVGQSFDPYIHQAVERVETDEVDDHTVLKEHQRGYNFKGRLLRPAMVRVAVKPSSRS